MIVLMLPDVVLVGEVAVALPSLDVDGGVSTAGGAPNRSWRRGMTRRIPRLKRHLLKI